MLICDTGKNLGRWAGDLPRSPGGFRMTNARIDHRLD